MVDSINHPVKVNELGVQQKSVLGLMNHVLEMIIHGIKEIVLCLSGMRRSDVGAVVTSHDAIGPKSTEVT